MDQVELPSQVYLKYDGVEYRGGRGEVIVAKYSSSIHPHPFLFRGGKFINLLNLLIHTTTDIRL